MCGLTLMPEVALAMSVVVRMTRRSWSTTSETSARREFLLSVFVDQGMNITREAVRVWSGCRI